VDVLRGDLNDSADGAPPQLRTDLLKLHQLAMAAFNEGSRSRVAELFDLAVDLQDQVDHLMTSLEQVQETLSRLTAPLPRNACPECSWRQPHHEPQPPQNAHRWAHDLP